MKVPERITLRNVEPDVFLELEKQSKLAEKSMNEYINQILKNHIDSIYLEKTRKISEDRYFMMEESILQTNKSLLLLNENISDFILQISDLFDLDEEGDTI